MFEPTKFALWQRTLGVGSGDRAAERGRLANAFLQFRQHTSSLVGEIHRHLPDLTVHDISHLDALWRVADTIAGKEYPLNPAEAFVLGGAILLHDAGHAVACFADGVAGIRTSVEWRDAVASLLKGVEPDPGSMQEQLALFHVLRQLHAKKARSLAMQQWSAPDGTPVFLLEDSGLRVHYGDLIGKIAESHNFSAMRVVEDFRNRVLSPPSFLPTEWQVDALKVAFLLRVADAAHIDAERAPWFLFALRQPNEQSDPHWRFQAKLGQPARTERDELRFSSGSPFSLTERKAWWLAYDTARMVDRELRDASTLLRENARPEFAVRGVEGIGSPESFAVNVATEGWVPVNVAPTARNVAALATTLGGRTLYGDRPWVALRELLQNGADAVRVLRSLGVLSNTEGTLEVSLDLDDGGAWLHVRDSGVGMSRYVLTEVLLDFGSSLWNTDAIRADLPGLAASGFGAVGKFGIGFFSVFMLGSCVRVKTRRFEKALGEETDQWILEFSDGLFERPSLRKPGANEGLRSHGTLVSVRLDKATLDRMLPVVSRGVERLLLSAFSTFPGSDGKRSLPLPEVPVEVQRDEALRKLVAQLCPALDIHLSAGLGSNRTKVLAPDDWMGLADADLLRRVNQEARRHRKLRAIRGRDGAVIGRITYTGDSLGGAALAHRGILAGRLPGLAGVLVAENNVNAARTECRPVARAEDWREWAGAMLGAEAKHMSVADLAALHPLLPGRDLPVYLRGTDQLKEAHLRTVVRSADEIVVHDGLPAHEDYDDISADRFSKSFKGEQEIIFVPSERGNPFLEVLQLAPIDYLQRIRSILTREWGGFDEFEADEYCVGYVDSDVVNRRVTLFQKSGLQGSRGGAPR